MLSEAKQQFANSRTSGKSELSILKQPVDRVLNNGFAGEESASLGGGLHKLLKVVVLFIARCG